MIMEKPGFEKILVVDDEIGVIEAFKEIFSTTDYQVQYAQTGKSTLAKLDVEKYNLVILDNTLPDYESLDLLEQIKKRAPFNPPTTILFHIDHLIENIMTKLKKLGKFLFSKIASDAEEKEKIGLFFALLEVVRRGKAKVFQEKPFDEIFVEKK